MARFHPVNKKALHERDRCTVFITPPRVPARRGEARRTNNQLRYKPNLPLAIGEAEDHHGINGVRMRRAFGCGGFDDD